MKKFLHYFFSSIWLILLLNTANGQAPVISYTTPNTYTVSSAITALTPTNTGGAVPAATYGQVTTLLSTAGGLNNPQAIASDGAGNVYVADYGNNKIRKVTSAGVMTTLAGSGTAAETNGTGAGAAFNGPDGICYDGAGNLYVADAGGHTIRKIVIATGVVTTFAGIAGSSGTTNSTLLASKFNGPAGLDYDASTGNIYVCDQGNNTIRKISGGNVTTLAGGLTVGGTTAGSANGTGVAATFNSPNDLVADGFGNVFVADYLNSLVRKIVISTGVVTTFAGSSAGYLDATGTAAQLNRLGSISSDALGNLYVADLSNQRIRLITQAGVVTTIAGSGSAAETDGTGLLAAFSSPGGIDIDGVGNCYILDFQSGTTGSVRKMSVVGYSISATPPTGLTFTATTGTISGTPTATSSATNYTITAYNLSGSSSAVVSIAVGTTVAWTGGNNTQLWATGSNWSSGIAPTANDVVTIGVSAYTKPKEPIISTAVSVYSITFGNTGGNHTLTVTSPGSLTVGKTFTVNNGVTANVAGTGAVNISPGANLNITGTGVLNTTLTGALTLQSDATGSASVGQILTTSITGSGASSINVERYLNGGAGYRGYRLLSSPVYVATVGGVKVCGLNYLKNDIYLTGAAGGGFDKTGNPTIYLFREDQSVNNQTFTTGNFWGISAINNATSYNYFTNGGSTVTNIPVSNGYMVFFRGDRSATTVANETVSTYVPVASTLTSFGTLNAGQITVRNWYTTGSTNIGWTNATSNGPVRGYNLVGNPYASSIDWEQYNTTTTTTGIYASNVGTTIYELNPATGNYNSYQVGGAFTNQGSRTIVSGQAFFVIASAAPATLIFNESAKAATAYAQNTGFYLFMAGKATVQSLNNSGADQHVRLQLMKDSINTDDVYIGFNSDAKTEYVYNEDAPYKTGNGQEGIASISSDNVPLAINRMPLKGQSQVIKLKIDVVTSGTYKLNMLEIKSVPPLYNIWLVDTYKKDSLDMRHNRTYTFDIDKSDTNTYGSNRFRLVMRQNSALAVHLLSFTATKAVNGSQLTWKTENEQNYTNFTIERSTDGGKSFVVLGGFLSSAAGTYSFLDKNPLQTTTDWYRIKLEDLNGSVTYSNVIKLEYSGSGNNSMANRINIYPNPTSGIVNLSIAQNNGLISNLSPLQAINLVPSLVNNQATAPQSYEIKIISITGSVIKTAKSKQPSWQGNLSGLTPGTYIIQVSNSSDSSLVGKSTFVKL